MGESPSALPPLSPNPSPVLPPYEEPTGEAVQAPRRVAAGYLAEWACARIPAARRWDGGGFSLAMQGLPWVIDGGAWACGRGGGGPDGLWRACSVVVHPAAVRGYLVLCRPDPCVVGMGRSSAVAGAPPVARLGLWGHGRWLCFGGLRGEAAADDLFPGVVAATSWRLVGGLLANVGGVRDVGRQPLIALCEGGHPWSCGRRGGRIWC